MIDLRCGNSLDILKTLPDKVVQCIVTSPPFYGLRDYGTAKWEGGNLECDHKTGRFERGGLSLKQASNNGSNGDEATKICPKCGAVRIDNQIGLESTPDEYVKNLCKVFDECWRVLRDDGLFWLNLGDSYSSFKDCKSVSDTLRVGGRSESANIISKGLSRTRDTKMLKANGFRDKSLMGIPWRVAFALQERGWILRSDIIWCLSGGAYIYAKTQKGEMPMMIRDMARLDSSTVKLWNGNKWTQVLGWARNHRNGNELEIVLRSGERISCTPTHKFPTQRGLLQASEFKTGDCLKRVKIPEPENPRDCVIDNDAAWFAGLYIAEGSRSNDCIQIAGHSKEMERWIKIQSIASKFGGSTTRTVTGNIMNIRIYGKVLNAIIDTLVSGHNAHDKGFASCVWNYSNNFLYNALMGYLNGDGGWDGKNNRWRLGFCRNYNLEGDLRTLCARLGYKLILNLSSVKYNGKNVPTFRGEIRFVQSQHHNIKNENEIIKIRNARCREVYDIEVEDEPYLFSLASGVLAHNSKPNPMPESVKDRCTKSHEYIFMLSKQGRYYYDGEAIKEPSITFATDKRTIEQLSKRISKRNNQVSPHKNMQEDGQQPNSFHVNRANGGVDVHYEKKNKRDVWTVTTKPYKGAHFATFPEDLIRPCILAGSRIDDVVLDPFCGAGTTGVVCKKLRRKFIGIDLNENYIEMSRRRIEDANEVPSISESE